MTTDPSSSSSRKWTWRAFWIIWALIFIGVNAWDAFLQNRAYPFAKSYVLGADQVDEVHHLSWLAWGHYRVDLRFEPPFGVTYTDSKATVREVLGGDIAIELQNESGEAIIPRKFMFAAPPVRALHEFDYLTYTEPGYSGFETKLHDRYTLHVSTIKTGDHPDPRRINLALTGMDAGYLGIGWTIENVLGVVVLAVSALILRFVLRALGPKQENERPATGEAPTDPVEA